MFFAVSAVCFFFFVSPKKKQKRRPEIENSPISGGSLIWLLYYCGEEQRFPGGFVIDMRVQFLAVFVSITLVTDLIANTS